MYKIGITGSIGSGKTTIANKFALLKIPVFDADKEVKKLLARNEIKNKIKEKWPNVIQDNYFDKLKLRSIIFSNKIAKKQLEKILYPKLQIIKKGFEEKNNNKRILVYDVPLIYETKSEENYDLIILANCDKDIQKQRVLKRDDITEVLFEKIIASQLSFNEKIKYKPTIVKTDCSNFLIFTKVLILLIKINYKLKNKKWKKKEY